MRALGTFLLLLTATAAAQAPSPAGAGRLRKDFQPLTPDPETSAGRWRAPASAPAPVGPPFRLSPFTATALGSASRLREDPQPSSPDPRPAFWRPIQPGEVTLFGALERLGQSLEQDRWRLSRGIYRPVNFEYKAFRYEKDFFNVYKGVNLKSFWEGRMDFGLFSQRPIRGSLFGPGHQYQRPHHSTRYGLQLRWNLSDR